jgi:hypothetical protein
MDMVVAAAEATTVSASVPSSGISAGAVFEAEFSQGGESLLSAQTVLE